MQTDGKTNDGQYIVKMNAEEHQALFALQEVVKGKEWGDLFSRTPILGDDLSNALTIVRKWCECAEPTNNLQRALTDTRQLLGFVDVSEDASG